MDTTAVSQLVSELEGLSITEQQQQQQSLRLPSLQQFYTLGLLLFRVRFDGDDDSSSPLTSAYRQLIESIPDDALSEIFDHLYTAAQTVLFASQKQEDWTLAVRSISGLVVSYSDSDARNTNSNNSTSRLCRILYNPKWIRLLAAFLDRFVVASQKSSTIDLETNQSAVLACLSRLLLDGLVLVDCRRNKEESMLEAIRAMEEESSDCLRDLQAWQDQHEPFSRTLERCLLNNTWRNYDNDDGTNEDERLELVQQREYIRSMLESARIVDEPMVSVSSKPTTPAAAAKTSAATTSSSSNATTELDRRIQRVLQVLPHFGEGFVEVALGIHKGDVESTVATLLNHEDPGPDYPNALRVLDPKLPRRKKEFVAYQSRREEEESAAQARKDVKERIQQEEQARQKAYEALVIVGQEQQEKETAAQQQQRTIATEASAPVANKKKLTRKELRQRKLKELLRKAEYDDDYDDQYDEVDIKLGSADDGFATETNTTSTSLTFEQIKIYNQVVQEEESDTAFWESNRNTNAAAASSSNNKKEFGPDKIKGGRVLGPDGKIVRKPGGVKKKNNNKPKGNNNNNATTANAGTTNTANNKKKGPGNNNNNNKTNSGDSANNNNAKKKPQTKPRRDNRVGHQRDRKLKKQGAFGVQE